MDGQLGGQLNRRTRGTIVSCGALFGVTGQGGRDHDPKRWPIVGAYTSLVDAFDGFACA